MVMALAIDFPVKFPQWSWFQQCSISTGREQPWAYSPVQKPGQRTLLGHTHSPTYNSFLMVKILFNLCTNTKYVTSCLPYSFNNLDDWFYFYVGEFYFSTNKGLLFWRVRIFPADVCISAPPSTHCWWMNGQRLWQPRAGSSCSGFWASSEPLFWPGLVFGTASVC